MAPIVERIEDSPKCLIGEAPHWDSEKRCLYYVDVFAKTVHKYNPTLKQHSHITLEKGNTSFIIPVRNEKNKFVVSMGKEVNVVTWDEKNNTASNIKNVWKLDLPPEDGTTWNDGKCDSTGRIWAGTLNQNVVVDNTSKGNLYSIDRSNAKLHLNNIGMPNGIAFDEKAKKFYYIDTLSNHIESYDFDIVHGTIENRKVIYSVDKEWLKEGLDGMTIDTDGNLWVAVFNGSKIIKINPRKTNCLLDTILIPAKEVTSLTFGGPNLDELYITSAGISFNNEDLSGAEHGALYRVTGLNARGLAASSAVL